MAAIGVLLVSVVLLPQSRLLRLPMLIFLPASTKGNPPSGGNLDVRLRIRVEWPQPLRPRGGRLVQVRRYRLPKEPP